MNIVADFTAGDLFWSVVVIGLWGIFVAALVLALTSVWRRPDWSRTTKIVVTVLLLVFAWVGVIVYGIVDVLTRGNVSGEVKAGWIAAIILLPIVGIILYLIWSVRNPVTAPTPRDEIDILPGTPQGL
jgi:hypothetical protein